MQPTTPRNPILIEQAGGLDRLAELELIVAESKRLRRPWRITRKAIERVLGHHLNMRSLLGGELRWQSLTPGPDGTIRG